MLSQLIVVLIYALVFGLLAYGAWWICVKFGFPKFVFWIVGAILLLVLLVVALQHVPGGAGLGPLLR